MRTINVTECVPARHRNIWVTGWEPLGNVCHTTTAKMEATPYLTIEPGGSGGQYNGSWGKHYFTPGNLLVRSMCRWCYWSEDWSSYDYVKYSGATIYILPPRDGNWMINFDPYFQYQKSTTETWDQKNKEDLWDHPGILLHTPHTHLIMAASYMPRKKMYKIRLRPPPGWKGYQRFPTAFDYILFHWCWTLWFPFTSFFDPTIGQGQGSCEALPWWSNPNQCSKWVNRSNYEQCGDHSAKCWGPFLQSKLGAQLEFSVWFKYKIKLTVAGDSIWRPLPRNFRNDGMVPAPEGPTGDHHSYTETYPQKRKRPHSTHDIWPDDLDSDGILKDRSYQRITGDNKRNKRRKLQQRRLRHLASKLRNILDQRGLLKRNRI